MRLLSLALRNIGPFDEAHLDFRASPGSEETDVAPVTFVTGENGTGKSIVIDAIRLVFGEDYSGKLSRPIAQKDKDWQISAELFFRAQMSLNQDPQPQQLQAFGDPAMGVVPSDSRPTPRQLPTGHTPVHWVVDYWQSTLGLDSFTIENMGKPRHQSFLQGSLAGQRRNQDTTQWICYVDYLRSSDDEQEKRDAEELFQAFQDIARECILDGEFAHVVRSRLEPMFKQRGRLLGISKLSAGSLYFMTRMLGLLSRMYSCYLVSSRTAAPSVREIPGLLLIDEAENHLHPRWQKRFIPTIQKSFPNLQIIVATHSPFILASVHNARVYVCRSEGTTCTVTDVSDEYVDRPIDEILMSPAFAETRPFSQEITELLDKRKAAIEAGNEVEKARIEKALLARNPDYFRYLTIESLLGESLGGGSK